MKNVIIVALVSILFLLAAPLMAQGLPLALEIDQLLHQSQSGPKSVRSVDDPQRAEQIAAMQRAAELSMQFDAGQVELSARELEKLDIILSTSPVKDQASLSPQGPMPTGTLQGTLTEQGNPAVFPQGQVRAVPFGTDVFNAYTTNVLPDGTYTLIVPPGRYVLQTQNHPEHVRQAWPGITCVDRNLCNGFYGGDVIEVADGSVSTHDFQLDRGVRVTGTVTDALSNPIPNAFVRLVSRNRSIQSNGFADASGVYLSNDALPPGDYRVVAEPADFNSTIIGRLHDGQLCEFGCNQLPVSFATINDTMSATTFNFQLVQGFGLSGTVFESDGITALEGAFVQLASVDGYTFTSTETDASGNYEFPVLRPTDYNIIVTHPERLGQVYPSVDCFGFACSAEVGTPISLGAAPQALDFDLQTGNSVSGTIRRVSDGTPVEGVAVGVFNSLQGSNGALTDAAGNYFVGGLPEGTFFVSARPNQVLTPGLQRAFLGNVNCPASQCGDFGTPLTISAGDALTSIDLDLPIGGGLSGQLIDVLSTEVLGFVFVPRLELWVASGPFAGQLAGQGLSEEFGTYTLNGLMPGSYKATFGTSSHLGLIDTAFGGAPCPRGSCDQSVLPTVFVTAGTVLPGISATLPRGPVISGTVRDSLTGDAPELLASGQGGIIAFYGPSGNYASFSAMDGEGFYRSRTGFPSETFYASTFAARNATAFGGNYIDQVYNGIDCPELQCNVTGSGAGLTVVGSDITGVDFNLRQGGAISGRVRDLATTDDLAGIAVEAYDGLGRRVGIGRTRVDGAYSIDALPTGSYFVRTRNLQSYLDQLHSGASCTPFCDPVNGTPVAVTEGASTVSIDFDLVKSAALSGTISLSGVPIANVTVEVYGAIGNFLASTLSAADGSFEFSSLAAGEFYLRTRNVFGHADVLYNAGPCVGGACQVRRGDPIVLAPGASLSGLALDLSPGASINGEVNDRLTPATKLSGVRVQLLDDRGAVAFEATTNAAGQFNFDALAAGDYHLVTRGTPAYVDQTLGGTPCPSACNGLNGSLVTIAAGAVSGGNDLDLAPGASISGNVQASAAPSVSAIAQVYNAIGVPVFQSPTNPSGNYEINQLPDGDFFVRITNVPGHVSQLWDATNCTGYCDILNGDPVTIAGSTSVGSVNFNLPAGGAISGQVTDGSSALAAVEVLAFDLAGFLAGRALSNASGNYTIGGLENGNYKLRTTNTGGFVDSVFGGATCSPSPCILGAGSSVNIAGAPVNGIDFALSPGGTVSGTATDQFGNPLISGDARLLDENGIELDTVGITQGLWSFDGLADGIYFLLIENDLGLIDELYSGVPCPAGACDIPALGTPIVLGGGRLQRAASSGIGVELGRGASISGRVIDNLTSEPIIGATVFIRNAAGQLMAFGVTDGLGEYRTAASLPDGDYYVATASGQQRGVADNYVNELYDQVACALDCDLSLGNLISVNGSNINDIDFSLARGAGVSGQVLQNGAGALVQVEVRFFDAQGRLAGVERSDSQGRYRLDGLPAGSYFAYTVNMLGLQDVTLGDTPCEEACDPLSGQSVVVPASGFVTGVDFTLSVADGVFDDRFELAASR